MGEIENSLACHGRQLQLRRPPNRPIPGTRTMSRASLSPLQEGAGPALAASSPLQEKRSCRPLSPCLAGGCRKRPAAWEEGRQLLSTGLALWPWQTPGYFGAATSFLGGSPCAPACLGSPPVSASSETSPACFPRKGLVFGRFAGWVSGGFCRWFFLLPVVSLGRAAFWLLSRCALLRQVLLPLVPVHPGGQLGHQIEKLRHGIGFVSRHGMAPCLSSVPQKGQRTEKPISPMPEKAPRMFRGFIAALSTTTHARKSSQAKRKRRPGGFLVSGSTALPVVINSPGLRS